MKPRTKDVIASFLLAIGLVGLVVLLATMQGCATQPELTTGVRTITVYKPVPVPCVDAKDIPEEYATAIPDPTAHPDDTSAQRTARNAAGTSADLRWLVPRYRTARTLLVQCSQGVKP